MASQLQVDDPNSTAIYGEDMEQAKSFQNMENLLASAVSICRLDGSVQCQIVSLITVIQELQRLLRQSFKEIKMLEQDIKDQKHTFRNCITNLHYQVKEMQTNIDDVKKKCEDVQTSEGRNGTKIVDSDADTQSSTLEVGKKTSKDHVVMDEDSAQATTDDSGLMEVVPVSKSMEPERNIVDEDVENDCNEDVNTHEDEWWGFRVRTEDDNTNNEVPNSTNEVDNANNEVPNSTNEVDNANNEVPNSTNEVDNANDEVPNCTNEVDNTNNADDNTNCEEPDNVDDETKSQKKKTNNADKKIDNARQKRESAFRKRKKTGGQHETTQETTGKNGVRAKVQAAKEMMSSTSKQPMKAKERESDHKEHNSMKSKVHSVDNSSQVKDRSESSMNSKEKSVAHEGIVANGEESSSLNKTWLLRDRSAMKADSVELVTARKNKEKRKSVEFSSKERNTVLKSRQINVRKEASDIAKKTKMTLKKKKSNTSILVKKAKATLSANRRQTGRPTSLINKNRKSTSKVYIKRKSEDRKHEDLSVKPSLSFKPVNQRINESQALMENPMDQYINLDFLLNANQLMTELVVDVSREEGTMDTESKVERRFVAELAKLYRLRVRMMSKKGALPVAFIKGRESSLPMPGEVDRLLHRISQKAVSSQLRKSAKKRKLRRREQITVASKKRKI
ncbi:uncharacterized protein MAL13P1.304-like isoform X2 [Xenia sp. Carnegie-2017]|uniref:uncharacterized protein MAL13P1.304-like isoform X2 n=1 Tax=Xenia sp. Carnegie-2017 TaxID=2897299 RepID=UPI001F0456E1|nr:uncharacterized protein MAL13P1.304-like isoform X2 [Xenia sp. Carnegie-2017]